MDTLIREIKLSEVTRSYNGRLGCACGCKGLYAEANAAATRLRLNVINDALQAGRRVYVTELFDTVCYEYEYGNGRVTKIYAVRS
jgi:hypothetical protein